MNSNAVHIQEEMVEVNLITVYFDGTDELIVEMHTQQAI